MSAGQIIHRMPASSREVNDVDTPCDVCGFGIDERRTQTTDRTIKRITTSVLDPSPFVQGPAWTNCPFCHSAKWRSGGRRGTL